MRLALIGLATAAATLAAGVQLGHAQESFFNDRFCTWPGGGRDGSGQPDCSYNTWEQCIASAQGLGRYCAENPFWRGGGGTTGQAPRSQRRRYQR